MPVPAPMPAASWLLESARMAAEEARGMLATCGAEQWQGASAVHYRNRLSGLSSAASALVTDLEEAAISARAHERRLAELRQEWGDLR